MPDKRSEQHIDKKFIRKSWKEMSALLDNEMPVKRNYTNLALWLLSGLLVFAISALLYLLISDMQRIPVAELTKEKIVYQPVFIEKYLNEDIVTDEPALKTVSDDQNQYFSSPFVLRSHIFKSEIYNSFYNRLDVPDFTIYDNSDSAFNTAQQHPESVDQLNRIDALSDENLVSQTDPAQSAGMQLKTEEFNNKRKVKFNVSFLALVSNNFDYSGFGLGSGFQIPIGNRLGVNTGIAVNFITRDYAVLPIFQKDNQDQLLKSNEKADLEQEETFYSGLRSFNQIYVPLNIQYNFRNGWSINSGVKFRYTYSEQMDNVLETQANRKLPLHENADNVFFTNTNVGISAGLGYMFNDKFSLSLDSEWGLSSLINKDRFRNPSATKYDLNLINLRTNYIF